MEDFRRGTFQLMLMRGRLEVIWGQLDIASRTIWCLCTCSRFRIASRSRSCRENNQRSLEGVPLWNDDCGCREGGRYWNSVWAFSPWFFAVTSQLRRSLGGIQAIDAEFPCRAPIVDRGNDCRLPPPFPILRGALQSDWGNPTNSRFLQRLRALLTRLKYNPLSRDRCSNTPVALCFLCYRCYTPTSFRKKMAYRSLKTDLVWGVLQKMFAFEAYRAVGGRRTK